MLNKILTIVVALFFIATASVFGLRGYIITKADARAEEILSTIKESYKPAYVINATYYVFSHFQRETTAGHPILAFLRPYLSNEHLPNIIRVPTGAIETITGEGWCDDAARSLSYILGHRNIASKQWNMIGNNVGHSALLVDLGGGGAVNTMKQSLTDTTALADPYYGYVTINNGNAYSPYRIHNALHEGKSVEGMLVPLSSKSNAEFYRKFGTFFMGAQGDPMAITIDLPPLDRKQLALGIVDEKSDDELNATLLANMTPTLDYVGHKFDRGWVRELVAHEPMRIDLILIQTPDKGVLSTFTPPPQVDGKKLSWNLLQDEKIISNDGKATISWTRLNSYIGIDQILLTPLGATP